MLCWMPYGVIALLATFGRRGLVTPVVSVVPSILAKFSTVVNPVIYMFFNNQVRALQICNAIDGCDWSCFLESTTFFFNSLIRG